MTYLKAVDITVVSLNEFLNLKLYNYVTNSCIGLTIMVSVLL